MLNFVALLLTMLAAYLVAAETAYFAFQTKDSLAEFVFQLNDDARIAQARRILSGVETEKVHVLGIIRKETVTYNPGYEFHLDPETIVFFKDRIEVCDYTLPHVNNHIVEACGGFLPGCLYCPWSSRLTKEIKL